VITEKTKETLTSLVVRPLTTRLREMKQGQVGTERQEILKIIQDSYVPHLANDCMVETTDALEAGFVILEAGMEATSVKPIKCRDAIIVLKNSGLKHPLARAMMNTVAGKQLMADAEVVTRKSSSDDAGDLSMKKARAHETRIAQYMPKVFMGVVDHTIIIGVDSVNIEVFTQCITESNAITIKVLDAIKVWSSIRSEEQEAELKDVIHTQLKVFRCALWKHMDMWLPVMSKWAQLATVSRDEISTEGLKDCYKKIEDILKSSAEFVLSMNNCCSHIRQTVLKVNFPDLTAELNMLSQEVDGALAIP
jgi:hypothetical protein